MRVQKCVKGSSVAYPDEQTYHAITNGYCIPYCGLNTDGIHCKFEARFRKKSSFQSADLATAPFTIISGVDFKHMQTLQTAGASSASCTESDTQLCGCQIISTSQLSELEKKVDLVHMLLSSQRGFFGIQVFKQSLPCTPFCSQASCSQSCDRSACAVSMGPQGSLCVGVVDQAMIDFVRSANCAYDEV